MRVLEGQWIGKQDAKAICSLLNGPMARLAAIRQAMSGFKGLTPQIVMAIGANESSVEPLKKAYMILIEIEAALDDSDESDTEEDSE